MQGGVRRGAVKALALALLVLTAAGVTGCADRISVDRQIFALGLGIDKGEKRAYRFSIIYPEFGGSQTDGSQQLHVAMAEADSVQEATLVIDTSLARQVNYSHINYIVASEPVAREGSIRDLVYQNEQWIPILAGAAMIVARDDAYSFLQGHVVSGDISFDKQQQNAMRDPERTALFSYCSLFTYLESCATDVYDAAFSLGAVNPYAEEWEQEQGQEDEAALATQSEDGSNAPEAGGAMDYLAGEMIRHAGATAEMYGSALFDNECMVGELSGNETQWLMMANGRFENGYYSLRDVDGIDKLPLLLSAKAAPDVQLTLGDAPRALITVHLEADMQGMLIRDGRVQPKLDDESEARVREALSRCIADGLYAVSAKCQRLHSDAMALGKYAIKQFATVQEWQAYRWKEKYPQMDIAFEVDVSLVHYNTRVEAS